MDEPKHARPAFFPAGDTHDELAGQRAFSVIPVEDGELSKYIRDYAEKVWANATALFPRPDATERARVIARMRF